MAFSVISHVWRRKKAIKETEKGVKRFNRITSFPKKISRFVPMNKSDGDKKSRSIKSLHLKISFNSSYYIDHISCTIHSLEKNSRKIT